MFLYINFPILFPMRLTASSSSRIITRMEPNDNFDDFDTQIQSDELIPDGYEDQDDCDPDPEFVNWNMADYLWDYCGR